MKCTQWKMEGKVGPVYLVASETGLRGILWKPQAVPFAPRLDGVLALAVAQLTEYFRKERTSFDLPLEIHGTDFQKRVWKELTRIPYGRTDSYRAIADRLRHPNAVRAVGAANGKNPLSIILPCHRVIASDGNLCGYAGGLSTKAKLLALERLGFTSMFDYCTRALCLSESHSYSLISVARKSVEVPALKSAIESGKLHLSNARRIISVLTPVNQQMWIEKATSLTQRELEREIVKVAPERLVKERLKPVQDSRSELKVGVSSELEHGFSCLREGSTSPSNRKHFPPL